MKEYLSILETAAKVSEKLVDDALECLFDLGGSITSEEVKLMVLNWRNQPRARVELKIDEVQLSEYDGLLETQEAFR